LADQSAAAVAHVPGRQLYMHRSWGAHEGGGGLLHLASKQRGLSLYVCVAACHGSTLQRCRKAARCVLRLCSVMVCPSRQCLHCSSWDQPLLAVSLLSLASADQPAAAGPNMQHAAVQALPVSGCHVSMGSYMVYTVSCIHDMFTWQAGGGITDVLSTQKGLSLCCSLSQQDISAQQDDITVCVGVVQQCDGVCVQWTLSTLQQWQHVGLAAAGLFTSTCACWVTSQKQPIPTCSRHLYTRAGWGRGLLHLSNRRFPLSLCVAAGHVSTV